MIERCNDGSYAILATAVVNGTGRAYALRVAPDLRGAVVEARLAARRRRVSGRGLVAALTSAAIGAMLAYLGLGSGPLSVLLGAAVFAVVAHLALRGRVEPHLAGACEFAPVWLPIEGIRLVGRRAMMGRSYSVFAVRLGGKEYHVALTDEEVREVSRLGFVPAT